MRSEPAYRPKLQERVSVVWEATCLVVRALLRQRMGAVLPLALVLLLMSYAAMALGILSPLGLLPRSAQVVPFIYPLF